MVIFLKLLLRTLHADGDMWDFALSVSACLLANPVVAQVNLVDGFSGGVVDACLRGSFGNVHSLLVNQMDKFPSFVVWDRLVFFSHMKFCL